MSKEFAIKICIQRIRTLCGKGQYEFVKRHKNMQALFDLGLRVEDIISILQGVSVADYISGPEDDYDGTKGQIWKFRHPVSDNIIYIKLKFQQREDKEILKILSFHPEEL